MGKQGKHGMKEALRLFAEDIVILGGVYRDLIGKNITPWLSEKLKSAFSVSPGQNLPPNDSSDL